MPRRYDLKGIIIVVEEVGSPSMVGGGGGARYTCKALISTRYEIYMALRDCK